MDLLSLLAIFTAAGVVFMLAPGVVDFCRREGLVAVITERRSHKTPTPHGGGVLLPLVVTPLGLAMVWGFGLPFQGFLTVLLLAGLMVALVGWQNDHTHIDPRIRLAVHLPCVALALAFLPQLFDFMPIWAEKFLLLLAWGWFVNLYNFMDGADGLASSEAIFISLGLALITPAFAPLALLIMASTLGFLRVNWSPAKVFMGDVGSTWFGYVLGGLLLVSCADDTWHVIWPLASLPLVFCLDATSTLIRRVLTGYHPWEPHKTFWFHRYLALGHSHRQLAVSVARLNALILAISLLFLQFPLPAAGLGICILVVCFAMWYIRRQEKPYEGGR